MDHVAGYTMSNDVSTRDLIERPGFPMTDLLLSKCRPTFFPTGPYMVPAEFVPDYRKLRITLSVNGEVMQDEGVDDIIYGVDELMAYASSVVDLAPGDLLLTGSPAGNAGHHNGRWLRPGDVMEGTISGLGVQRNRCVADARQSATVRVVPVG
jgi:2-keto-4-pentenoate hydratase/2-oxohepta-3-ene-1,7-dioic acid hydratase in catechol pathway